MFIPINLSRRLGDLEISPSRKLLIVPLLFLLALGNTTSVFAQYKEVKRLGTSQAICPKPGVQSVAELQTFFSEQRGLVEKILSDASWQGNTNQLFDTVARGEVTERQYTPGTTFEWMGMREKGVPTAQPRRVWAGESAFDGYEVTQTHACKTYQIVVPKICCNVALASVEPVVDTPALTMTATDRSLKVCGDPDASVTLVTPTETDVLTLDENACWIGNDMPFGFYTATAETECGSSKASAEIAQAVAPAAAPSSEKRGIVPFIAAIVGSETLMRLETAWQMEKRDTSGLGGIRGGLKIPLSKTLDLVPTVGVMHRTGVNGGNDYPDNSASLDLGIEKSLTRRFFIGAGVGLWSVDDSDFREPSVFVNTGGEITKSLEWFAELRGIDSDNPDGDDGISDNHFYGGGLRFKF